MDKKKIIIAIILFIFLGLAVFSFAQTPDEEGTGSGTDNSGNGSGIVTTTKVSDDSSDEDSDSRGTTTTRTTTAARNNTTTTTTTKVTQTGNEADKPNADDNKDDENQGIGNGGADETVPTIVINGKTLENDVDEVAFAAIEKFVVDDNNDTVIKVNGEEVEIEDLLAILSEDGEYLIEVSDGTNTRTLKLTVDTEVVPSDLAILNVTHLRNNNNGANDSLTIANIGDQIRVYISFKEELAVLPKLVIGNGDAVEMKYTEAMSNSTTWTYYYDYTLTDKDNLAEGEISFKVYGYEDALGNTGEATKAISNAYNTVALDTTAPTVTYSVHGSQVRIKADEKVTLNVKGWTSKNDGTEWRKSLEAGKNYEITATDEAGNSTTIVIDRILPDVVNVTKKYEEKGGPRINFTVEFSEVVKVNGGSEYVTSYQNVTYRKDVTLTFVDEVGNTNTYVVEVDLVKPTATVSYDVTTPTNGNVTATMVTSEEIQTPEGWTKKDAVTYTKVYVENVDENIEITDLTGNHDTVNIKIENIEKIKPTVTNVTKTYEEKGGPRINFTVEFSEPVRVNGGAEYVTSYQNVTYAKNPVIYIVDEVGNKNTYVVEVDLIKPTAEVSYDNTELTTDSVTATMVTSEEIQTPEGWTKKDAITYTKVYTKNVDENIEIYDLIGNHNPVNIKIQNILEITSSKTASNYIDTNANTIYNFNSFALKFNRDLTIKNFSTDKGFKIEFEYSTDGVNYTKSTGTVINNYWTNTLMKSSTEKYTGDEFTIIAGSPILWSGTKVGSRWTDIYNAILATEGTENQVYVRTIFTVIQPNYQKSFTLDPVVYSQGGAIATPNGTAVFE